MEIDPDNPNPETAVSYADVPHGTVPGIAYWKDQFPFSDIEVWTVKDGAPVMLVQSHARDKYYVEYLADENAWLIANEGSGGAASSVWFYYALQNGELALMQGVTSESGAWYMTYDTDYDVSNDTPSDEAACQAIIDSHTERYTALDYTPYTELRQ